MLRLRARCECLLRLASRLDVDELEEEDESSDSELLELDDFFELDFLRGSNGVFDSFRGGVLEGLFCEYLRDFCNPEPVKQNRINLSLNFRPPKIINRRKYKNR